MTIDVICHPLRHRECLLAAGFRVVCSGQGEVAVIALAFASGMAVLAVESAFSVSVPPMPRWNVHAVAALSAGSDGAGAGHWLFSGLTHARGGSEHGRWGHGRRGCDVF